MKHTPAPWGYVYTSAAQAIDHENQNDGGGANGSVYAEKNHRTIVYLPHHRDTKEDKEREANARLIAAAPELLEALAGMLRLAEYESAESRHSVLIANARAAILKAKGE